MENGGSSSSPFKVVEAAVKLKNRKTKKKKHRLNKFERKYSELGPRLKPEHRRVDFVLVHEAKTSEVSKNENSKELRKKKEATRRKFEAALKAEGFSIRVVTIEENVFKLLHCPFKRLCSEAERVKLEMPLKGCEKYPAERMNCVTEFIENHLETDNEVDFVSAPFKMNKIDLFENYENPTYFFRPALRSYLTHHILINIDIRDQEEKEGKILHKRDEPKGHMPRQLKAVEGFLLDLCSCIPYFWGELESEGENKILQKIGLPYLLMKEVYNDAFILHEQSELTKTKEETSPLSVRSSESNQPKELTLSESKKTDLEMTAKEEDEQKHIVLDPRKVMDETWTVFWKYQPMWKIRNYFGEKNALYFGWCGMLATSLWVPTLFGMACFFFGISVSAATASESGLDKPTNLTLEQSLRYDLGELMDIVRGSFDNQVTPFFALVICLWGTLFLELWKRRNYRLAYEWDVDGFENNEPDRPQFFGTKVKKDPVTQEDNWFYPFKRQLLKFCLSASALIFMVSIVFVSLAAVIVYRVILTVDFCPGQTAVECLVSTTLVSALLNALSILLLGRVYDWVAVKLTEWENHRTQTQYDDALIIKLFAFQFANSYASCFYIAFFRGRFDAFGVFGLGPEYSDACDGSCMSQLSFQVLILMLAKPFPKFLKDIILPFVKWLWRNRPNCCRFMCCKNQVQDEEKEVSDVTPEEKATHEFILKEYQKTPLNDFTVGEYTEKIILYGFLMLFAASFPLAPLLALIILLVDMRVDAKRLLWLNRRPIAFIAEDIGMWYGILNFVNLCGVISNGFLIAFTSSWGQQFDIITQLWICIGFEHLVFALKFILAYMIPDVPKDVRLAMRREKYQVFKKFEDLKAKKINYAELIPEKLYNDGVREDSVNYVHFSEDEEEDDDQFPPITKPELAPVAEETFAIQSDPTESLYAEDTDENDLSMRQINPQGSKLLGRSGSSEHLIPKEGRTGGGAKHKLEKGKTLESPKSPKGALPSFVPSHSDYRLASENTMELPAFPPKKKDVEKDSHSSASSSGASVDPYQVVSKADIAKMPEFRGDSLTKVDETNC